MAQAQVVTHIRAELAKAGGTGGKHQNADHNSRTRMTAVKEDSTMKRGAILIAIVALAAASLVLSACGFSVSTANIQDATLAKGYDNGNAVDATNVFAAENQEIHLVVKVGNAPDDTNVKAVWSLVAVAGQEPAVLYESPLTLNSGETVAHFTLSSAQPWPAGKYKVEVYLDDKLDRTLEYEVKEPEVKTPTIESATLAKGYEGNAAVDPTNVFAPDDLVLHLAVTVANPVEGTSLKAVWSVVDVKDYTPAVIDEVPYTLSAGERTTDFQLTNNQPWPAGKYKVELYLNDQLVQTLEYVVQEAGAQTPFVESATLAKGYEGGEAVDPTTVFAQDDLTLHLVVKVANPVEGTSLKAVWSVAEVAGYEPQAIDEVPYTLSAGENSADFSLTNNQPWPVGKYKVELYLNDQLVQTLEYEVQ